MGASLGAARAAVGAHTPIGAAIKMTQIVGHLIRGRIGTKDAMVQGFGAAIDMAAGVAGGPVGHVAQGASKVMSTVRSVKETASAVGVTPRTGEALARSIAAAAERVARSLKLP